LTGKFHTFKIKPHKAKPCAEMTQIAAADKNYRLIKGQVFPWEGAKNWRDIWGESHGNH